MTLNENISYTVRVSLPDRDGNGGSAVTLSFMLSRTTSHNHVTVLQLLRCSRRQPRATFPVNKSIHYIYTTNHSLLQIGSIWLVNMFWVLWQQWGVYTYALA